MAEVVFCTSPRSRSQTSQHGFFLEVFTSKHLALVLVFIQM